MILIRALEAIWDGITAGFELAADRQEDGFEAIVELAELITDKIFDLVDSVFEFLEES